jgi:hypothetical protein
MTSVTVTGTGFVTGAKVFFASAVATDIVFLSSTKLTCLTPAGSAGSVDVTVRNPSSLEGLLQNGFTFVAPVVVGGGGGGGGGFCAMTPGTMASDRPLETALGALGPLALLLASLLVLGTRRGSR